MASFNWLRHTGWFVAILCLATSATAVEQKTPKLVFSYPYQSPGYNASTIILEQAYARLGVEFSLLGLPVTRALEMANNGATDGELSRIAGLQAYYPNLIQISVPVNAFAISAYINHKPDEITVNQFLTTGDKRIGCLKGIIAIVTYAEQHNIACQYIDEPPIGLEMLVLDRLDAFITPKILAQATVLENNYLRLGEYPISVLPLYHYLHKRHSQLAARLTAELALMEDAGLIKQYVDGQPLLDNGDQ